MLLCVLCSINCATINEIGCWLHDDSNFKGRAMQKGESNAAIPFHCDLRNARAAQEEEGLPPSINNNNNTNKAATRSCASDLSPLWADVFQDTILHNTAHILPDATGTHFIPPISVCLLFSQSRFLIPSPSASTPFAQPLPAACLARPPCQPDFFFD